MENSVNIEMGTPINSPKFCVVHVVFQVTLDCESEKFFLNEILPFADTMLKDVDGFIYRSIQHIKKVSGKEIYVLILAFKSVESLRSWMTSDEKQKMIKLATQHKIEFTRLNEYGGQEKSENGENGKKESNTINKIRLQNTLLTVPRPNPPARWKLFLLTLSGVFFTTTCINQNFLVARMVSIGFPVALSIFFNLCHLITFLVYSYLPLIQLIPYVDYWLKIPRLESLKNYPISNVLVNGLAIFSSPPYTQTINELKLKLEKLESRIDVLKKAFSMSQSSSDHHSISNRFRSNSNGNIIHKFDSVNLNEVMVISSHLDDCMNNDSNHKKDNSSSASKTPLTLAVAHFVKWECSEDFLKWTEEMSAEMSNYPGFLGLTVIEPQIEGDPYINTFTYNSLDSLLAFLTSQRRVELLSELDCMLMSPSLVQLTQDRVISNAISEQFVSTNGVASLKPFPLWKVCIFATIPIFLVAWPVNTSVYPSLIADHHVSPYAANFVCNVINVLCNVYIGVPMMHAQFGEWMRADRVINKNNPLHYLDVGLPRSGQIFVFVLYFALLIIFGNLPNSQ